MDEFNLFEKPSFRRGTYDLATGYCDVLDAFQPKGAGHVDT